MNTGQLKKRYGLAHRLWPLPTRLGPDGRRLDDRDDHWTLEPGPKGFVVIRNPATGHVKELGHDNIREFRSPDILILRCRLIISGREIRLEPFEPRRATS